MAPIQLLFAGKLLLLAKAVVVAFTVSTSPKKSFRTTSSSSSSSCRHLLTLPQLQQPPPSLLHPLQQHEPQQILATSSVSFEKMCQLFKVEPGDNLYLSNMHDEKNGGTNNDYFYRGVHVKTAVREGDVILSIPISSCFRDDEPPGWFQQRQQQPLRDDTHSSENNINNIIDEELHITDYERYNPSAWSSRLAASILDMDLCQEKKKMMKTTRMTTTTTTTTTVGGGVVSDDDDDVVDEDDDDVDLMLGREMWQSFLPDKDILRASLPVHWSEDVLATAKCTALELAVDSAYFARANAVSNLSEELWEAMLLLNNNSIEGEKITLESRRWNDDVLDIAMDMETLQQKCHYALDIVQTRACRVDRTSEDGVQWGPPLRIIAPVFDFINHGSSLMKGEVGCANARFGIENERVYDLQEARLVVRATRDLAEGEEVLIDYGDSARPNWRCLTSYGFVPDHEINSNFVDEDLSNDVAELWMNGLRFEVDTQSVPYDLVEVAAAQLLLDQALEGSLDEQYEEEEEEEDDNDGNGEGLVLSPLVARAIAKRATEAALNLILEPDIDDSEELCDAPDFLQAMNLAALLRWSQHKVLMAFADNLTLFAASTPEAE